MSKVNKVIDWIPDSEGKRIKKRGNKKGKKGKSNTKAIHATLDVNQLVRDVLTYVDHSVHERLSVSNAGAGEQVVKCLDGATTEEED